MRDSSAPLLEDGDLERAWRCRLKPKGIQTQGHYLALPPARAKVSPSLERVQTHLRKQRYDSTTLGKVCLATALHRDCRLSALVMQDLRIDFQFDTAAFDFRLLPFKVPYPVPFKLFGDETKVCLLYGSVTLASLLTLGPSAAFSVEH